MSNYDDMIVFFDSIQVSSFFKFQENATLDNGRERNLLHLAKRLIYLVVRLVLHLVKPL